MAQTIIIIPVAGGVYELREGLGALLHEQSGDGPVALAVVEVVAEKHAVNDFVGFRVTDRQHDVFDQTAVAGGVDSVNLGGNVIPVVGNGFDAPVSAAE